MKVINEVQASYYTQSLDDVSLHILVNIGVLVHVQTSVCSDHVKRYFVPVADAHEFQVVDYRGDKFPLPQELTAQVTADERSEAYQFTN